MGMGGSDVEQQAQYHPRGVSSALLFTINASVLAHARPVFGACKVWTGSSRVWRQRGVAQELPSVRHRTPRAIRPFLCDTQPRAGSGRRTWGIAGDNWGAGDVSW